MRRRTRRASPKSGQSESGSTSEEPASKVLITIDKTRQANDWSQSRDTGTAMAGLDWSTRIFNSFWNLYSYFYERNMV